MSLRIKKKLDHQKRFQKMSLRIKKKLETGVMNAAMRAPKMASNRRPSLRVQSRHHSQTKKIRPTSACFVIKNLFFQIALKIHKGNRPTFLYRQATRLQAKELRLLSTNFGINHRLYGGIRFYPIDILIHQQRNLYIYLFLRVVSAHYKGIE
ncbi:uncharacterized protein ACN427_001253 isoform 1-T1 [Glossina fuscipes fuscipes]